MHHATQIVIIGGGLAGSCLAARFAQAGYTPTLIDNANPQAATRIAAGLYNLVTGKRYAPTWKAAELVAALYAFADEVQLPELRQHIHPKPVFRPFPSVYEANRWAGEVSNEALQGIVSLATEEPIGIHAPYGGLLVPQAGWVNTKAFAQTITQTLHAKQKLNYIQAQVEHYTPTYIELNTGVKVYYDHLVLCQGVAANEPPFNTLFDFAPIIPLKGQILEVKLHPEPNPEYIWVKGHFLFQIETNRWVIGSTYEHHYTDLKPTAEAQTLLLQAIPSYFNQVIEVEVLAHRTGLRPTTPDRRPYLGTHPQHANIHFFNGLGTKGILHAPYFSKVMQQIIGNHNFQLPPEINILRFKK